MRWHVCGSMLCIALPWNAACVVAGDGRLACTAAVRQEPQCMPTLAHDACTLHARIHYACTPHAGTATCHAWCMVHGVAIDRLQHAPPRRAGST